MFYICKNKLKNEKIIIDALKNNYIEFEYHKQIKNISPPGSDGARYIFSSVSASFKIELSGYSKNNFQELRNE